MKERIFPMSEREAKEKGEGKASIYNRHCKFARRMLSLRTEAGLSQQKVADLLEVSKSTISLYETGYTVPDAKTIYKLCDIYHVSADYLLCRTDYRATGSQSMSIEKYGFSERAAQNLKLVQMMELVAAKGKEQPLKSSGRGCVPRRKTRRTLRRPAENKCFGGKRIKKENRMLVCEQYSTASRYIMQTVCSRAKYFDSGIQSPISVK